MMGTEYDDEVFLDMLDDDDVEGMAEGPCADGEVCDVCGKPAVWRVGDYGPFLACKGFPKCKWTASKTRGKRALARAAKGKK